MFFEVTSLSSKGQVVIPSGVRDLLRLKTGTKLGIITDGKNLLLKPLNTPQMSVFKDLINMSRAVSKKADASKKRSRAGGRR